MELSIKIVLVAGALAFATLFSAPSAIAKPASPLAALDTDNDGTVDLGEINKSAEKLFDQLEGDKDGTLELKELKGRLSKKDLKAADPDNDGTLSREEFLSVAGNLFKSADQDNDGTLDAKELGSRQGKALLKLTH